MAVPDRDGVGEHAGEAHEHDYQSHVVLQNPYRAIEFRRFGHKPLGPHDNDRQAVQRPERRVRLEMRDTVRIDPGRVIAAAAAVGTGIRFRLDGARRHVEVEAHGRAAAIDGEGPVEAGNVPVQLVVILEEAEHPRRTVTELVGMDAVVDEAIAPSEIGAYAVAIVHDLERFACIVAQYGEGPEVDDVAVAEPVKILGRKIPVDSAADAVALGAHPDRFRDLDPAVLHHGDVAVKLEDPLVGRRERGQREQQEDGERPHSTEPSLTSGTLAASSDRFWKNSRGSKLNRLATKLLGTVSVIVL